MREYEVEIFFAENLTLTKIYRAKDKDQAFELLFVECKNGWLTESKDYKDVKFNLNNAIQIEIVDVEERSQQYKALAKSYLK